MIDLNQYASQHRIKFGTSGIRALNTDLTDEVCYLYTTAFMQYLASAGELSSKKCLIAGDLRVNTDRMIHAVYQALVDQGYTPDYCGKIPTPALCYYGLQQDCPGIMVTGSHIPDNMNGLKFYKKEGEILKADEQAILSQHVSFPAQLFNEQGSFKNTHAIDILIQPAAYQWYLSRYLNYFPANALRGLRVGVYCHSSVAIPALIDVVKQLGAEVIAFGHANTFYALDTEALSDEEANYVKQQLQDQSLNVVISTDGDGDRPLMTDEQGHWIHGDILGMLCAILLKARYVVVPISCNSSIDRIPDFEHVYKTKIGSPYVIEEMNKLIQQGKEQVIGFESNGGVLIGTDFTDQHQRLSPLPTRDSLLPILCILAHINQANVKLSSFVHQYARAYTASQSIKPVSSVVSAELFAHLNRNNELSLNARDFFHLSHTITRVNILDGLAMQCDNGEIIYLRQSGNAPELRCYTEASTQEQAKALNQACIRTIKEWMASN